MARRTKYTPEVVKRLTDAIKLGATYELACGYAGIHYDTFRTWMHDKPAFSEQVKRAEGQAAIVWLGRIEQAAKGGTWQAAAWMLERRYPQQYGRVEKMALTKGDGSDLNLAELLQKARALRAAQAGAGDVGAEG